MVPTWVMEPPGFGVMACAANRLSSIVPMTFTSKACRHDSQSPSVTAPVSPPAVATFTRMSIRPRRSRVSSTRSGTRRGRRNRRRWAPRGLPRDRRRPLRRPSPPGGRRPGRPPRRRPLPAQGRGAGPPMPVAPATIATCPSREPTGRRVTRPGRAPIGHAVDVPASVDEERVARHVTARRRWPGRRRPGRCPRAGRRSGPWGWRRQPPLRARGCFPRLEDGAGRRRLGTRAR